MSSPPETLNVAKNIILASFKIVLPDVATRIEGFTDLVDILLKGRSTARARKTLSNRLEESADFLAERLADFAAVELRELREGDRLQAIEGVSDAIAQADITLSSVIKRNIEPYAIYRTLIGPARNHWAKRFLSEAAIAYGERFLEVSCMFMTAIVRELPEFSTEVLLHVHDIVARTYEMLQKGIATVMMPRYRPGTPDETAAFEAIYLSDMIQTYKDMELFGLTDIPDEFCRQPVDIAYITLRTHRIIPASMVIARDSDQQYPQNRQTQGPSGTSRVDRALSSVLEANRVSDTRGEKIANPNRGTRVLITGGAGSGKTTVAHWLALKAAQRRFPEPLGIWNNCTPFFVALRDVFQGYRRYIPVERDLIAASSHRSSSDLPGDWIQARLRASPLLILDGVDELSQEHRSDLRIWISQLERDYPRAHIVVTSRPEGISGQVFQGFSELALQPMDTPEITLCVRRWFDALISIDGRREHLHTVRKELLIEHLASRPAVKDLAETPLVCAMLCAFYSFNLSDSAPQSRGELYQRVINALVHDREGAKLSTHLKWAGVPRDSKLTLLQAVARYMTEHVMSSIPCRPITLEGDRISPPPQVDTAKDLIKERLSGMPSLGMSVEELLKLLLERSVVFRKVGPNEAAFVHRSLQEYLAAADFAENGAVDELLRYARQPSWRGILAFASSSLPVPFASRLVAGILDQAERLAAGSGERREVLLLAAQCHAARRITPTVADRARQLLHGVLPPLSLAEAELVAFAGEEVLPWLRFSEAISPEALIYSARAAALTRSGRAIEVLGDYAIARRDDQQMVRELLHDWQYFDATDYARRVLTNCSLEGIAVTVNTETGLNAALSLSHITSMRVDIPDGPASFELLRPSRGLRELDWPGCKALVTLKGIGNFPGLRRLRLDNASELASLEGIERLPMLRELHLKNCSNLRNLGALAGMASLKILVIDKCTAIEDFGPVASLAGLITLSLNDCHVMNLDFCKSMANLRRLSAVTQGNAIRNIAGLTSTRALRRLDISVAAECQVDMEMGGSLEEVRLLGALQARHIECVGKWHSLRKLSIDNVRDLRTLDFLTDLRHLRELAITNCSSLTSAAGLIGITSLESLNLRGSSISDLSFVARLTNLCDVRLAQCRYISDFSHLERLRRLKYIDVTGAGTAARQEALGVRLENRGNVLVIRDSFDSVDDILDGGFYGPTG